jgi:GNAT superfamily N-acetyltransferase
MLSSVSFRPITQDDRQTVARHRYPELSELHPALATYAHWLTDALTQEIYRGWFHEKDGQIVAGIGLILLNWGPSKNDPSPLRARVVNVYTAPEIRREGLARSLLTHALEETHVLGIQTVSLGTSEMGQSLYEEFGFQFYASEMLRSRSKLSASAPEQ